MSDTPLPHRLLEIALMYRQSKSLFAADELGVFDALKDGRSLSLKELRENLNISERSARDFFDCLVAMGVLNRREDRYSNTPEGEAYLVKTRPAYLGGLFRMYDRRSWELWKELAEGLRTGRQLSAANGEETFSVLYETEEEIEEFQGAMFSISYLQAETLAAALDVQEDGLLVDVGGGTGAYCVAFAQRFPKLRCAVFDLPRVEGAARRAFERYGIEDRTDFISGDFFHDELPSGDVMVFSQIIHDWSEEKRAPLLRKAWGSLKPGGLCVVTDFMYREDRSGPLIAYLSNLNMLLDTEGSEYRPSECRKWLESAGFRSIREIPLLSGYHAVVGTRT